MNEMITHYLPLVHRVVNRIARDLPAYISREDLISMGTMGLIGAIDRFAPEKGIKFETFATWRIRGAVLDGLREMDWVPRQVRQWAKEIERAYAAVEATKVDAATDEEVADYLGIGIDEFHRRMAQISMGAVVSLEDALHRTGEEQDYYDVIPDPDAENPDSHVIREEIKSLLEKSISRLPEKEKLVVALYYYEELSIKEISEIMEISQARVSQLHTKAICRLRGALSRKRPDFR